MADIAAEQERKARILKKLQQGPEAWDPTLLSSADEMNSRIDRTAYDDIAVDPRYSAVQRESLDRLGEISKKGYTAEEEAAASRLKSQANQDDASRRASILQQMQMRGGGGGGAELAAMLSSADAAAERQSQGSLDAAANAQRRQLEALGQRSRLASDMQSEEYQQAAKQAEARDRLKQFNADIAKTFAMDRNRTQNQAGQYNTGARNDWSMRTNEIDYNDAVQEENRKILEEQERQRRKAQRNSGIGSAIGAIGGGIVGGYTSGGNPSAIAAGASAGSQIGGGLLSDERQKKNIVILDDIDVDDFMDSIAPKGFDYKNGPSGRVGVVAQDIEKNPIGAKVVREGDEGKELDVDNLLGAVLASISRLERKKKDR